MEDVRQSLQEAGVLGTAAVRVGADGSVPAQGFRITVQDGAVGVTGGDGVGAMYGLFELSEQIRNGGAAGDWPRVLASLTPTNQHPPVEFRADNPFIHATDTALRFDVPMWKQYIDMLARDRFNVLDLHGAYNLQSTQFPNIYPLLVHVPEYPRVGDPVQQARNLADFREIVSYANNHGVKVALMDYSAEGLAPQGRHAGDYLSHAVAALLREVPELSQIGFRIGESGHSSGFLKDAFLRGIALSGRKDVRLYTRSWLTPQRQVEDLGRSVGGSLDVEIKYNGEQLGPPYQAIGKGWGSYSYEGYIHPNAPYRIIWQIRANGTHRFWAWADASFIRRCVRTLTLGRARGFTLEPHIAYFPYDAASYYRSPQDAAVYRYQWQRHWMWYYLWGRIAYNPQIADSTLTAAFSRHYGPAGPAIYAAMQAAGPIVPLVCAYRFQGPDQRQWSPETETGCFVSSDPHWWFQSLADRAKAIGLGGKYPITVMNFGRQAPMDTAAYASMSHFIWAKLNGEPDGRVSPAAVAGQLSTAAAATRAAVAQVGDPAGNGGEPWRLLKVDLLGAADLGDFYADRILAILHLDYALQTGSASDYQQALDLLQRSRAAWSDLASTEDAIYAPLNNGMRKEWAYQWSEQVPMLDRVDATASLLWDAVKHHPDVKPLSFTPRDRGEDLGIRVPAVQVTLQGDHAAIRCQVTSPAAPRAVILHYRALPSESDWHTAPMVLNAATTAIPTSPARPELPPSGGFPGSPSGAAPVPNSSSSAVSETLGPAASNSLQYSGQAPLTPAGTIYFIEVQDGSGQAVDIPQPSDATPYWLIDPWQVLGINY